MTKGFAYQPPRYWLQVLYTDGGERWLKCNLINPTKQRQKAARIMQKPKVDAILLIDGKIPAFTEVVPDWAIIEDYNREEGVLIR